jgi:hypothetical protein
VAEIRNTLITKLITERRKRVEFIGGSMVRLGFIPDFLVLRKGTFLDNIVSMKTCIYEVNHLKMTIVRYKFVYTFNQRRE